MARIPVRDASGVRGGSSVPLQSGAQGASGAVGRSTRALAAAISGTSARTPQISIPKLDVSPVVRGAQSIAGVHHRKILQEQREIEAKRAKKEAARKKFADISWETEASSQLERQMYDFMHRASQKPPEDLVDQVTNSFTEWTTGLLEAAPSQEAALAFTRNSKGVLARSLNQSLAITAKSRKVQTVLTGNSLVSNAHEIIADSPSEDVIFGQRQKIIDWADAALEAVKITPEQHEDFVKSANNVVAGAAEFLAGSNPDLAEQVLKQSTGISLPRQTSIKSKIATSRKTHDDLDKAMTAQLLKSNIAQIEETGEPLASYNHKHFEMLHGEDKAFEAELAMSQAMKKFDFKTSITLKRPEEIRNLLEEARPKVGSPEFAQEQETYDDLQTIAKKQIDLFNDSPFEYSLQDPAVLAAFRAYEDAPDEVKTPYLQEVIGRSRLIQAQLKVPPWQFSVTTRRQAKTIAATLNNTEDVEGEILRLSRTYGAYLPDVLRDTSRLPSGERVDPMIDRIFDHIGKDWVSEFGNALRVNERELNLTETQKREVATELRDNDLFAQLKESFLSEDPQHPELIEDVNGLFNSIRKYALTMVNAGEDIRDAVDLTTERVIGSEYSFGKANGRTYHISRRYEDQNGREQVFSDNQLSQINEGLRLAIEGPRFFGRPTFRPDLIKPEELDPRQIQLPETFSPEQTTEALSDAVKDYGFWMTSADGNSAVLYRPGVNGQSAPFRKKDGTTVQITFEEASKLIDRWNQKADSTPPPKSRLYDSFSKVYGL